jgi:hypothetical protein
LLATETGLPQSSSNVAAKLVWFHSDSCHNENFYLLKHGTRTVRARISKVLHRLDVNTLRPLPALTPQMNDIAAVHIETTLPLFFDPYSQDRVMGSFILIDPMNNATVAAGMIEGKVEATETQARPPRGRTSSEERVQRNGHPPAALWIVGRPTLAEQLEKLLLDKGWQGQLVSNKEFPSAELKSVARVLHRMGAIAVCSVTTDDSDLREAISTVYGNACFFSAEQLPVSDREASAQLLSALDGLKERFAPRGRRQ